MSKLGQLVTFDDCNRCRLCCWFTRYDIWETPVITDELKALINEKYPETEFITKGNDASLFIMKESPFRDEKFLHLTDSMIYYCPCLGENGCRLGNEKPFECSIWPYRIMSQDSKLLISLSCLCKPMCNNSLESIMEHLTSGLAKEISDYAKIHPGIIKEYNDGYPILMYLLSD
jgi:Fe-S-cluster containining protein